ncbi:UNVERIFIED_CONTAM: hypothetical protein GTU68_007241 [Idotea baltica]|nr:hypothetical protein [Idotea baltica]
MIHNGREAQEWLEHNKPKLILLDLMLPEVDGVTICRDHRKQSNIPIIMITAKVEEIDRLIGLEMGADDYICKPFSPREVVARIKTVLRRSENIEPVGQQKIMLNENNYQVTYESKKVDLTAVEFKLFQIMFAHPGRIFSRDQLMDRAYNDSRIVSDRTVDSHIKKLRKKINNLGVDDVVQSVYGVGYRYQG